MMVYVGGPIQRTWSPLKPSSMRVHRCWKTTQHCAMRLSHVLVSMILRRYYTHQARQAPQRGFHSSMGTCCMACAMRRQRVISTRAKFIWLICRRSEEHTSELQSRGHLV